MLQSSRDRFAFAGPDRPPAGVVKPLARLLVRMAERRAMAAEKQREHEAAILSLSQYDAEARLAVA